MASTGTDKLAILAGSGSLPALVARAARQKGYAVGAFGFEGVMSPKLAEEVDELFHVPFIQISSLLEKIKELGYDKAVTIGGVTQTSVVVGAPKFDDLALELWRQLPDRRVDTMMKKLLDTLEEYGIKVLKVTDFLGDHLAPSGELTDKKPEPHQMKDVRFGFHMAKAMGGLDVGQTVVVKNGAVMAVEAVEGTDQAIRRGSELGKGGVCVVKVAKPGQDLRFDVPAVGIETIETMRASNAALLAVEAGMVLMVEKGKVIQRANDLGIIVAGLTEEEAKAHD